MAPRFVGSVGDVKEALECSAIADLRRINVEPCGKRVVLTGTVDSFYYKQLAQELVRKKARGLEIANVISVEYPAPDSVSDWCT